MGSDGDYQTVQYLNEPLSPMRVKKLTRLKKTVEISVDILSNSVNEDFPEGPTGSFSSGAIQTQNLSALEQKSRFVSGYEGLRGEKATSSGSADLDITYRSRSGSGVLEGQEASVYGTEDLGETLRPNSGFDDLDSGKDSGCSFRDAGRETKRALEFDSVNAELTAEGGNQSGKLSIDANLEIGGPEAKLLNLETIQGDIVMKSKRRLKDEVNDVKCKENKRRKEKEKRDHLKQLHVDTQRLLRETRDVAFKSAPPVQKPISSILEKIRKRKIQVSKQAVIWNQNSRLSGSNCSSEDGRTELDLNNSMSNQREVCEDVMEVHPETTGQPENVESTSVASYNDRSYESVKDLGRENLCSRVVPDEESKHGYRAPIDDTQDILFDSQTNDTEYESPNDQEENPHDEVLAPSLLAMNLKLDSAPADDVSSDEEDNDKENIDPHSHGIANLSSLSPSADPVKAFLDEEAEEEDDSDNDLFRFEENEEEDDPLDAADLNDMIATDYKEKPIDSERRHQLHQKWLEQQDATGTESMLQRLNCATTWTGVAFLDKEDDMEEDEECNPEDAENLSLNNIVGVNCRKIKKMMPQMFTDKEDVYVSSDDDETEKKIAKERLLENVEHCTTFLSPVTDENSREVFGLIKKLNIVPDTKKKDKPSSFFDMQGAVGNNSSSSSKSSFLGRISKNSSSSSHKHGSSTARSFIFGRDDSNSRSSISTADDSSDMIQKEGKRKTASAKFSGSQSKSCSQSKKRAIKATAGASLFEILKASSLETGQCTRDAIVAPTQTVFSAFKLPKKAVKIEGGM